MKIELCRLCISAIAAVSVSHNGFYIKSGEVTLKATSAAFAPLALKLKTIESMSCDWPKSRNREIPFFSPIGVGQDGGWHAILQPYPTKGELYNAVQ